MLRARHPADDTAEWSILGLNDPYHDSSICVYSPNATSHFELERFTREKYEIMNPVLALSELVPSCHGGYSHVAIEEGDFLAPFVRRLLSQGRDGVAEFAAAICAQPIGSLAGLKGAVNLNAGERAAVEEFASTLLSMRDRIVFCDHHLSHACNAFYSSPFERAIVMTLDGGGYDTVDGQRKTVHGSAWNFSRQTGATPEPLHIETGMSIGLAWMRVTTRVIGLNWGEEGTVMAMAALGDPEPFREALASELLWLPMEAELPPDLANRVQAFTGDLGKQMTSEQARFDCAAALQVSSEQRVRQFLGRFLDGYRGDLCLAGGVMLNCQITGKLRSWFPRLGRIFLPPAPHDSGISIGSAQFVSHVHCGHPAAVPVARTPFAMGAPAGRLEVVSAARSSGYQLEPADDLAVVDLLASGKVVAVFGGASETGRRALGHRSILADPRSGEVKQRINATIKNRRWFRPLAPMVLAEQVTEWFDVPAGFESPYMSFAVPVRAGKSKLIPAVLHVDGSARVQTVHRDLSPRVHAFLTAWSDVTSVPILLNTSFNDREPIVNTPYEAMSTLRRSRIDALYFMDFGLLIRA